MTRTRLRVAKEVAQGHRKQQGWGLDTGLSISSIHAFPLYSSAPMLQPKVASDKSFHDLQSNSIFSFLCSFRSQVLPFPIGENQLQRDPFTLGFRERPHPLPWAQNECRTKDFVPQRPTLDFLLSLHQPLTAREEKCLPPRGPDFRIALLPAQSGLVLFQRNSRRIKLPGRLNLHLAGN